ncbi:hypothetical protein [Terrisporobacter mayombei]|uniref:Uncharacterized protein n=1 Tax=Terrisporobacter mayombei TaxID=1541 RepID=A0ABY9Q6F8_9FIRM|nr:hypothetical protein [Terrisporobacter mayombei]WMT83492.1 hypothetical protein TEMA_40100 [Terrisporobacter mayombei]
MRILKCIVKIFFKEAMCKYKNLSYMELSIGLLEDDDIYKTK